MEMPTRVVQVGCLVPGGLGNKPPNEMLVFSSFVKGYEKEMSLLVDSGASQNFVSRAALQKSLPQWDRLYREGKRETMVVRLANGSTVRSEGVLVELSFRFCDFVCKEMFVVLEMGSRYDLILGMPWLAKHQPWIDWRARTIGSSSPSSDERSAREQFHAVNAETMKTTTIAAVADHPVPMQGDAVAVSPATIEENAAAGSPASMTDDAVAGSPARDVAVSPSAVAGSPAYVANPDVGPTADSDSTRIEVTSRRHDDGESARSSEKSNHLCGEESSSTAARSRARVNRRGLRKLMVRAAFAADSEDDAPRTCVCPLRLPLTLQFPRPRRVARPLALQEQTQQSNITLLNLRRSMSCPRKCRRSCHWKK